MDALPEECQYLTPEHQQESDVRVLSIHLETLWLLATRGGRGGRTAVRDGGTYPVVRELHLVVEEEGVRRACERLVDVIMGDEVVDGSHEAGVHTHQGQGHGRIVGEMEDGTGEGGMMVTQADLDAQEEEEDDGDDDVVPIF